ncbi:gamma-carotene 1'-hydroxylase CruF [Mastigocoleus sp. MO_188.B34]|uniref:gamma-carotene 1'-hydroxylase CruF n=1 Tax=Mastigocoleus sp. MO_188.B34 TaxID=3036635 RepID=UPI00263708C2|nr:carotenoid biosynthesis protein [Mastigocoleus sp. MO_188.B34]MDJ0695395.1 carotenoid biosynthesis protein [Mastigocoleus sp. MO_188.B34]
MRKSAIAERICLGGHILSLVFGLLGILLVIPHPEMLVHFGSYGQNAMQLSMAGGGVLYMILGATAVFLYLRRNLGLICALGFVLPSVFISLGAELLGTSTGFPFGNYSYLSGLGYKVAGLVPFTIPLSWFYVGCVSYLLARIGLQVDRKPSFLRHAAAVILGAFLLTSWDFVLDPAMSQTSLPFWYWEKPGAFFGMPYQNFAGWMGTGALFMAVAAFLWRNQTVNLDRSQLHFPLIVYLSNFAFAIGLSAGAGFTIPVILGFSVGILPAFALWIKATPTTTTSIIEAVTNQVTTGSIDSVVK